MNGRRGRTRRTLLRLHRDERGFGLLEAFGLGLFFGIPILVGVRWLVNETMSGNNRPPGVSAVVPAPLPATPTDLDPACVQNAYETYGLKYRAGKDPSKFEGEDAMWSIPGLSSKPPSVHDARYVEVNVRHRFEEARRKWTSDCRPPPPQTGELPQGPPPLVDRREFFTGTYRLSNWRRIVSTDRCTFDLSSQGNPLMRVESQGAVLGVRLSFPGAPGPLQSLEASFTADTFRATTPFSVLGDQQSFEIGGSFYERSDRTVIEDGYVKITTGSTVDCELSYEGLRQ